MLNLHSHFSLNIDPTLNALSHIQLCPRSQPEALDCEVILNHAYQKYFRHDSRHLHYSHLKFKKHKKHKLHTHTMALAALPRELIVSISEQLEECDINALSQTNVHLYDLLNEVLYQQNVNNLQGAGAWRAVKNANTGALMKFIAYGLNIHACGQPSNFAVNKALVDDDTVAEYEEHDGEGRNETKEEAAEKDKEKEKEKEKNEDEDEEWEVIEYAEEVKEEEKIREEEEETEEQPEPEEEFEGEEEEEEEEEEEDLFLRYHDELFESPKVSH